ncbi:hypothetical protein SKAU_G00401850 [Synaphobranchus kaupii]|uniref:Gastrin/cholecystokinin peptide hormone domain-containing protein n=1 Tax=Synaphobranchus kaupii TaxID=118154 RepID=A0A9Q1ICG6_SYNKA|nr:hypothetical protein SKAU_G00401850 [Synaphobranchus kaupii]
MRSGSGTSGSALPQAKEGVRGRVAERWVFKGRPLASPRSYPQPRSPSLRLGSSDCTSTEAMNSGICVCVLLAALSSSCLGRPQPAPFQEEGRSAPPQLDGALSEHPRHARSVPLSSQVKSFHRPEEDGDQGGQPE